MTEQDVKNFQEKYCTMCGSQRCPADEEAILTCGHYPNNRGWRARMNMYDDAADEKIIKELREKYDV